MWLDLLFAGIAILFALMTAGALFHLRWVHRLPAAHKMGGSIGQGSNLAPGAAEVPVPPGQPAETASISEERSPLPRISIVIAARDEAARIENTVRHLLAQQNVSLEIIIVDDRSTDGTSAILQRMAAHDTRVKPCHVQTLPDGWLGKCHACHVGASQATGDWILFTDADCWIKPDVIARALAVAKQQNVAHVTLTPGVAPETVGAAGWHLAFLLSLADWISGVNRDRPKRYLGFGAFNLVRAPAYRDCGGYEALRLTVLDDVKLGLLLCRAGNRTRAFIGGDDVECHWGGTVPQMIKIMEKNYFAAIEYRTAAALVLGACAPLVWLCAAAGPFTGRLSGAVAGLALCSLMVPSAILARRLNWPLGRAAVAPFVYPALFYAVLRSTLITLRQGGVSWRGTFYSLERLRAGNVR